MVERWPGSATSWDLARVGAPSALQRELASAQDAPARALQILNPPDSARYILTGETPGDRIRLHTSNDALGPVHWYLDGRYLATAQPRESVMLDLIAGRHKLVCMTPQGNTAQVAFLVAAPTAANPDFDARH